MKNLLLILFLIIGSLNLQAQKSKVIFVKQGAKGDGTSWMSAYGTVKQALKNVKTGEQIWVARGKYVPSKTADRKATFNIPSDVALYGGFAGTESSVEERNIFRNEAILSGEIGSPSSINDNSYTVIYTKNVSEKTIIDGFTIQGAVANGKSSVVTAQRCGGAWFNDASEGGVSSPTISNCTFRDNYAREGAGIYNYGKLGTCKPAITNCVFMTNKADLDGGAIFNNGDGGVANPIITDCKFVKNEATYGGAILNQGKYRGESSPAITNCTFSANTSYLRGGSLYNNEQGGKCEPIVKACKFADNQSTVGNENKDLNTNPGSRRGKSVITFIVK